MCGGGEGNVYNVSVCMHVKCVSVRYRSVVKVGGNIMGRHTNPRATKG